jgi:uncharacterized protein YneR
MKLYVSKEAAEWYRNELEIDSGNLRFFVRYGGLGGNIPGFSLGLKFDSPEEIHASSEINSLLFFIESADQWYFDGKDLEVTLGKTMQEPEFSYV